MSFEDTLQENLEFINRYSLEEWIEKLKQMTILCDLHYIQEDAEVITKANDYSVEYIGGKISKIVLVGNSNPRSYKMELDPINIIISKQEGYSKFEEILNIPIACLKVFLN